MKMSPQALAAQTGALLANSPPDPGVKPLTPDTKLWLARAVLLVEAGEDISDIAGVKAAVLTLSRTQPFVFGDNGWQTIQVILYRTFARAEAASPATSQGGFIPTGEFFSAFTAIAQIVGKAAADVLFVDPYADATVLMRFAVLVPETVTIRVLSDASTVKPDLKPALHLWTTQYGASRPAEGRLASARALHDRLIIVDNKDAWIVTQSFKDMAARSPTSILKAPDEMAALKVSAYAAIWQASSPA